MPEMHIEIEKAIARINVYLDLLDVDEIGDVFKVEHDYDGVSVECQRNFIRVIANKINMELELLETKLRNEVEA